MIVAVMMVVVRVAGHGVDGWRVGATVCGLAAGDLELNCGVGNMELIPQRVAQPFEDGTGLGHGHLGDGDMTRS